MLNNISFLCSQKLSGSINIIKIKITCDKICVIERKSKITITFFSIDT